MDAVGKTSFGVCKPFLTESGTYISTELGKNAENVWLSILGNFSKGKKVLFPIPTVNQDDIVFLRRQVESGDFKPVIDQTFELDEIVEA